MSAPSPSNNVQGIQGSANRADLDLAQQGRYYINVKIVDKIRIDGWFRTRYRLVIRTCDPDLYDTTMTIRCPSDQFYEYNIGDVTQVLMEQRSDGLLYIVRHE